MPISEVYLEDCMTGMARYPDKFFDLAIVDPPYGIGADVKQNAAAQQRIKAAGKTKAGRGWKMYEKTDWDSSIPNGKYWDELFRVSKNQIVWGGNYMTDYLPPSMGWVIWDKMQRDFSLADAELAWTSFDRAIRIYDISRGAATAEHNRMGGRFHPTQKPIELYRWLLTNYAHPGQSILDTHMGSQSSRIAAYLMGFDYYGFEIDPEYFEKGNKRFNLVTSQQQLW